ncbi:AAA family ATPase [Ramlibacter sp. USB13]|uniref:AAA family ATPase n=1 Tax=Ramlibacter cellulosilyticus TaxID=2764187 RepID=A0A923SF06_9BURK|nr:bifunctional aminoglycoside phosphotransferase/ATP-binding protein [Ramlibacter cellulosilyticus]MBC5783477.1 AAA family ATPase [Ramlibacter cellulosilyticus]
MQRERVERLARRLGAELVETHISWVVLLPDRVYKLKKPLRLPFVDYSTPERRQAFCEEEVRLNRRLAPTLYLGVSRVTGPADAPAFDGTGETLDHAVRMVRFPEEATFAARAQAARLGPADVDRLAAMLSAFHAAAPAVRDPAPATLSQRALAVLDACAALLSMEDGEALRACIGTEASVAEPLWQQRRASGHARDVHGDLHLANLLELGDEVLAFDCIEFDPGLRCIDVLEDAAFAAMDLAAHGLPALCWRFLNAWLEGTGEYDALPGLRLCLVYRALVRASAQHLREARSARALHYAAQALAWSRRTPARLVITHGLPGSGKTWASQRLLEREGAIRIRSDVERKRLHGLAALADSRASGLEIYGTEATQRTYERLFALASPILQAGWTVVLDAAFLRRAERNAARSLAQSLGVPFAILHCEAPAEVLRDRIAGRRGDASEADQAVLEKLLAQAEPLADDERPLVCA